SVGFSTALAPCATTAARSCGANPFGTETPAALWFAATPDSRTAECASAAPDPSVSSAVAATAAAPASTASHRLLRTNITHLPHPPATPHLLTNTPPPPHSPPDPGAPPANGLRRTPTAPAPVRHMTFR